VFIEAAVPLKTIKFKIQIVNAKPMLLPLGFQRLPFWRLIEIYQ
jgi:hypothetical protein